MLLVDDGNAMFAVNEDGLVCDSPGMGSLRQQFGLSYKPKGGSMAVVGDKVYNCFGENGDGDFPGLQSCLPP